MKRRPFVCLVLLLMATVTLGASSALAGSKDDYKKMRGYVNFRPLGLLGNVEPNVEVFLKGPLLKMARQAVMHEEPELAGALDGVKLVSVNVFKLHDVDSKDLVANTRKLGSDLEKKGWDVAVHVREKGETMYIYVLPGEGEVIDGLVVMAIEEGDEAVFVNIVGTIDPEQIGRIGHSIHIEGLDAHDLHEYFDRKMAEEAEEEKEDEDGEEDKKKKRTNRR